jgi:hypothetical protein
MSLHADRSKKQSPSWIDLSGLFGRNSGQDENTSCLANAPDIPRPDQHPLFSKHRLALRKNESIKEWEEAVEQAKKNVLTSTDAHIVHKGLSIILADRLGRRIQHMVGQHLKKEGGDFKSVLEPDSFLNITAQALISAASYTPADTHVVHGAVHLLNAKWDKKLAGCLLESRSLMTTEWINPLLKKASAKGAERAKRSREAQNKNNSMPQASSDHALALSH